MPDGTIFLIISTIAILAAVAFLFLIKKGEHRNKLSSLGGLAFALIIAGILFGENRFIGYGLMAVGVVLSIIDIFVKAKDKEDDSKQ
jgi:uncharacterized membrane protein YedE/YeeE